MINDRVELLAQLNLTLALLKEKRSNDSGVPARAVIWFDFGTVKTIPSDKIQIIKYDQIKRQLLFVQRDFTFFGIASNTSNLKDIVLQESNLVSVDSNEAVLSNRITALSQKLLEVPQIFQYSDCRTRPSSNHTYQGFIRPGFKQYWAMYPDNFLASDTIQLNVSDWIN